MNLTTKKIIIFVFVFLIFEIPVLICWQYIRSQEQTAVDLTAAIESTYPEIFSEAQPETIPFLPQKQDILETLPPKVLPDGEKTAPCVTAPEETEPIKMTIEEIPQYFQNDYPDDRYGTSTIARSGSGMTALAMVASYMTDHYYYPDELADALAHFLGNHYERLQFGSDLLQLSWKRAANIHEVFQALKDGKVAIVLMNGKSVFPADHHYIVLSGINEEGKITLLDPNKDHYSRRGTDEYLKNGIEERYLFSGFEGGWIYDKASMPDNPFIFEPEPYAPVCRYPDIELTDAEIDLLVDVIYMEGASEPFEGQQAIAEVILNRLASGNFQSSIYNIIHAEGQFPSVTQLYRAEPTYSQYKAVERALYGPYVLPENVVFYAKFAVNNKIWGKIGAHTFCYAY